MKYVLYVTMRSGREYRAEPVTLADSVVARAVAEAKQHSVTVAHAVAVNIHDAIGVAVRGEELVTLGPCADMIGSVAVSGREVEAVHVEVVE